MKINTIKKILNEYKDVIISIIVLTIIAIGSVSCIRYKCCNNKDYLHYGDDKIIPYKAACSICGHSFEFGTWNYEDNHHCICGQKMDWEEYDEERN